MTDLNNHQKILKKELSNVFKNVLKTDEGRKCPESLLQPMNKNIANSESGLH